MKLTNAQIVYLWPHLLKVADTDLSGVGTFEVAETVANLGRLYENIKRGEVAIAGKYAVMDEDSGEPLPVFDEEGRCLEGRVHLTDEGAEEIKALYSREVEVQAYQITPETLGEAYVSPRTLLGLGPLRGRPEAS